MFLILKNPHQCSHITFLFLKTFCLKKVLWLQLLQIFASDLVFLFERKFFNFCLNLKEQHQESNFQFSMVMVVLPLRFTAGKCMNVPHSDHCSSSDFSVLIINTAILMATFIFVKLTFQFYQPLNSKSFSGCSK